MKDAEEYLKDTDWRYRLISEVIADYIFVVDVDPDKKIKLSWASGNMVLLTGRTIGEAVTPEIWEQIIHPDDLSLFHDFIGKMLTTSEKGELECRSFHKDGHARWIRMFARQKKGPDGKLTNIVGAVREITKQKQLEEKLRAANDEKETLLREVHHRVKNNLQTVMTLIQMRAPEVNDATSLNVLSQLQEQIRTISVIHNELFQSNTFSRVSMQPYIELLTRYLLKTFSNRSHVKIDVDCDDIVLEAKWAMPCGLIVNELTTNSLKYAFPPGFKEKPVIGINFRNDGTNCILRVCDNGVGLPHALDTQNPTTIGLQLVNIWVKQQMKGTLDVNHSKNTVFTIKFSCIPPEKV
jgi:PAS domain S-box-containing protein